MNTNIIIWNHNKVVYWYVLQYDWNNNMYNKSVKTSLGQLTHILIVLQIDQNGAYIWKFGACV